VRRITRAVEQGRAPRAERRGREGRGAVRPLNRHRQDFRGIGAHGGRNRPSGPSVTMPA